MESGCERLRDGKDQEMMLFGSDLRQTTATIPMGKCRMHCHTANTTNIYSSLQNLWRGRFFLFFWSNFTRMVIAGSFLNRLPLVWANSIRTEIPQGMLGFFESSLGQFTGSRSGVFTVQLQNSCQTGNTGRSDLVFNMVHLMVSPRA